MLYSGDLACSFVCISVLYRPTDTERAKGQMSTIEPGTFYHFRAPSAFHTLTPLSSDTAPHWTSAPPKGLILLRVRPECHWVGMGPF
jgi:hypothetical protein